MTKTTVFLADDHAMVRMGLAALLGTKKDIQVIGEAEDGLQAVDKVLALRPDVVLMDLLMPVKDGVAATAEILEALPTTRILLLTSAGTSDGIAHALGLGAAGALLKSADFSTLITAIRAVAAGKRVIAPEIQQMLMEDPPVPKLTPRQKEILASVARGLSNEDIALQFGIGKSSAKEHVILICRKLGAANRAEAVTIALRKHLLDIDFTPSPQSPASSC